MDEKKCFRYLCKLFPTCKHAVTACGVDDWVDESNTIEDGSCTEENGYPFFEEKK
ncbi:hypothetical protein [Curtanaerobium respiraculi]|uniref:hypothetical protein n=1 Tax=Curtanaerobium respiraculi TaxID=2949669 RepID=UPI0024B39C02|nr:hypothetical protein [Curtanaerobium respiraculi]